MGYINAVRANANTVRVWERVDGTRRVVDYPAPYYFFIEDARGTHTSLFGDKCSRLDFKNAEEFALTKNKLSKTRYKLFESDIPVELKVLSEEYYNKPAPDLHVTYIDIEVDYNTELGFASASNPYAPINSVAICHGWKNEIKAFAVPPKGWGTDEAAWDEKFDHTLHDIPNVTEITLCHDEEELLLRLLHEIQDSDGLCGWNSDFFDIPYICKRVEHVLGESFFKRLSFEQAKPPRYREVEIYGKPQITVELGGRLSIDYMQLFKKFEMESQPSYKLENISEVVLPDMKKLDYEGSLSSLYNTNFNFFLRYNIRDVECLKGFEDRLGYVGLANEFYHSSTCLFKHVSGTIRPADCAIINYAHYVKGCVVHDFVENGGGGKADGAFVLTPKAGKHDWIGSIDINSLYPSAIRAINMSPETLMGQFRYNVEDFSKLHSDDPQDTITAIMKNGEMVTKTANAWKTHLRERNWAVSGYGTIFSQEVQGILPAILEDWYRIRKEHQRSKNEADKIGDKQMSAYYDRLQYCYKIKLNSLYGALLNEFFRMYDPRLGESTTGTGREILRFMCGKVNELLTGDFNIHGDAVIYGDTDSCYFKTYSTNEEEAIAVADSVANAVNELFPTFMSEHFFASDGYNTLIKCGREIVGAAGIFVTPKRYMIHVVNKDGKDCDEAKVMGLDIKKTILPKPIRIKLTEFLLRYLKGESWDSIAVDIVRYKDELAVADVFTLGLPKGVNGVEKYANDIRIYGENTRVPGHVRASIYYNKLLKDYEDKVSPIIVSESKIKVFYLTNPIGKNKSIALPADIEQVPEWFYKEINVDVGKQMERLVDNPLKNVLKAIEKEPPTKRTLLIHDTFGFEDE